MRAQLRDSLADGLGEHVLPHLDQADDRTTRLGRTDGLMDLAFFSDYVNYVSLYADMYDIHM
jgi:chromosome condensin MukBEF MukE localization factor